jgi:DNA-binding GntR family transcriptional regulator
MEPKFGKKNGTIARLFTKGPVKSAFSGEGKTIERTVMRDQIKKILSDAILRNELKPGERIVETRIARELSVSQAPVREALLELEQLGLVEILPYQGAFVRKPSRDDFRDAYSVRALLESEGAKEAALRITDEEITELTEIVTKMVRYGDLQDYHGFIKYDILFHERILLIAGNKLLYKFWSQTRMSNLTYVTTTISKRNLLELAVRHQDILNSLTSRDCDSAGKLMGEHIKELMDEVLKDTEGEME